MPNYRYHTPDYMRRNGCSRPAQPQAPVPCTEPVSEPVCCSNTNEYDELSSMPLAMAYGRNGRISTKQRKDFIEELSSKN